MNKQERKALRGKGYFYNVQTINYMFACVTFLYCEPTAQSLEEKAFYIMGANALALAGLIASSKASKLERSLN